eukprot:6089298-Pyramimonas_sp.AAC.2
MVLLQDGYNTNSVYFHTKVTLYTPFMGWLVLSAYIKLFNVGIPCWWSLVATSAIAVVHGVLWNTLHADSHGIEDLDFTDG